MLDAAIRIAVSPRTFPGDAGAAGGWRCAQLFFERTLLERLAAAGAVPVGASFAGDAERLAMHYADLCDGVLVQGGTSIDPALSGAAGSEDHDGDRDRFEIALVAAFAALDKPVLGVCRGMQILNVAFGGTLKRLDDEAAKFHSDPPRYERNEHEIALTTGGYLAHLFTVATGRVSSAHRQGVDRLGDRFFVEARAVRDGGIEALRSLRHRYLVGVQWHPEFDEAAHGRLDGSRLFEDFVAQARMRTSRADAAVEAMPHVAG